jgi:carbamoyltransferase
MARPDPAIVHVDGTARVQTVREPIRCCIVCRRSEAPTGIPVLITTSLNVGAN